MADDDDAATAIPPGRYLCPTCTSETIEVLRAPDAAGHMVAHCLSCHQLFRSYVPEKPEGSGTAD
jgi:hypothetical protein